MVQPRSFPETKHQTEQMTLYLDLLKEVKSELEKLPFNCEKITSLILSSTDSFSSRTVNLCLDENKSISLSLTTQNVPPKG